MNSLTKRSLWNFLALYLLSSLLLLIASSLYFYQSKRSMEIQKHYYEMSHIADSIALKIIAAHMHHQPFHLLQKEGYSIALFDQNKKLLQGRLWQRIDFREDFYTKDGITTLISQGSAMHLGVKYIVIQTKLLQKHIDAITQSIIIVTAIIALFIMIVAYFLSRLFLKPIEQKMEEIERFVKDSAHELNTPISSLLMSIERLKSKKVYDERIVSNISISVKNLKNLYDALSYISFEHSHEDIILDLKDVISDEVSYFQELLEKKSLSLKLSLESKSIKMAPIKAKMLINNLLSNAIKYSKPKGNITITLHDKKLIIEDEGIGIAKENLQDIFKRYRRANSYAGGFGVGLDIVKNICDEYNFKIAIFSKEHQGTKVAIVFS